MLLEDSVKPPDNLDLNLNLNLALCLSASLLIIFQSDLSEKASVIWQSNHVFFQQFL
jgi:hypothetical protein